MEFITEYGLFLAKVITLLVAALVVISALFANLRSVRQPAGSSERLKVRHLNLELEQAALTVKRQTLPAKALKAERKSHKARRKSGPDPERKRLFVIDFDGDLRASGVDGLREEINAILLASGDRDEVLIRLESPGGIVHGYGLAASQLLRIRDRGLKLTVAVDKVAASGGYMMACVADRILAAPFAIIGSIGVVAQLPNFNRLLKKHDIDYEQFMAGEYKRTLTLFGENSPEGRAKFQRDIEDIHALFKEHIQRHRPQLDIEKVATGEYWYGARALEHGLIDEVMTSDDFLLQQGRKSELFHVQSSTPKPLVERLMSRAGEALLRAVPGRNDRE